MPAELCRVAEAGRAAAGERPVGVRRPDVPHMAHAVIGAGADFDDDLLIAARTRVDFLVKTDDARAELEKALAACSDDASALGDAAARAVAGGLDPEEPLVASCRRRLGELLARDDDPPP